MAIWNLGSINIDHVYRLDHLPRAGETLAARSYAVGLGGKGANQSIAAARAGRLVFHLGAVGPGDDWVIEALRAAGICPEQIQRPADQATGHAIILLDAEAENSIVIHPGANRAICEETLAQALAPVAAGDTLLIQNETNGQVAAARIGRAAGARVIYSAAPFDLESVAAVMPHVSILSMNAGEAEALLAAFPGELPVEGLLITRGAEGAEYRDLTSGQVWRQPAFRVHPVDTTGAGDTFTGYFATALDRGDPIPEALRTASAAAALQVTRRGAAGAIPAMDEVLEFLAAQADLVAGG